MVVVVMGRMVVGDMVDMVVVGAMMAVGKVVMVREVVVRKAGVGKEVVAGETVVSVEGVVVVVEEGEFGELQKGRKVQRNTKAVAVYHLFHANVTYWQPCPP